MCFDQTVRIKGPGRYLLDRFHYRICIFVITARYKNTQSDQEINPASQFCNCTADGIRMQLITRAVETANHEIKAIWIQVGTACSSCSWWCGGKYPTSRREMLRQRRGQALTRTWWTCWVSATWLCCDFTAVVIPEYILYQLQFLQLNRPPSFNWMPFYPILPVFLCLVVFWKEASLFSSLAAAFVVTANITAAPPVAQFVAH